MTDPIERDLLDALRAEAYREPLLLDASTLRERLDRRPRRRGILPMAALPAAAVVAGLATVAALALITRPTGVPGISPSSSPAACNVTRPAPPFAAPSPFPAVAPIATKAWYGSDALWTMLNRDGEVWPHLGQATGVLSQKTFWWSKDFAELTPAITVTLTRLDGGGSYSFGPGTNATSPDLGGTAMLVGVGFPGPVGCWQVTAHYRGASLSYVVWIKSDQPSPSSSSSQASQPRQILCVTEEAHVLASGSFPSFATDVVVGPLSWPELKVWATADPSGYRVEPSVNDFKIGAQLKAGATVTVSVAPEAKAYAGLDYGQASGYSPALAVTFHACANSDTAYIGGFHVEGRRCVPFDVSVDGKQPVRIVISFFNGQCGP